ncbi:hypothetical protein MSAN_01705900 [Mycena sanguinolenta]|uniref:Uncharacterized protein n=1 Tax=Mycena sanguinolenta TaxID=230812 RepID=A0A8H6XZ70_9AGAR|nr:hypothetical protein MSAN_01705900 [Mycena sanguinolenta]
MDGRTPPDPDSNSLPPTESAYRGAFFPNSQHLFVAGGTFTSHNITTPAPPDYLRIPLGSIDLRNEIRQVEAVGVVSSRSHHRGIVRRMYSARVGCLSTPMTVALHPHILQLYATASSSGIHASVFHDDLIPFHQFLESFRHSAILQAYIYAYTNVDDNEAFRYCGRTLDSMRYWARYYSWPNSPFKPNLSVSLRQDRIRMTGTLTPPGSIQTLHDPRQESRVIASLALQQWYSICHWCLPQHRSNYAPVQAEVKLGSIIRCPSACKWEDATEIAWVVPDSGGGPTLESWFHIWLGNSPAGDGPVRYNCREVFGSVISMWSPKSHAESWLSQASYIFTQLKSHSNCRDYMLVHWVRFSVSISVPVQHPPPGYLFLCSPAEFKTGPVSFRWPDCPAYWCLDSSGNEPLSDEEASCLGFPPIKLTTRVGAKFWDDNVYAGLRKFHEGKGVDPDSQDVARQLGYPLYELSGSVPHVQEQRLALERDDERNDSSHPEDHVQNDPSGPMQEFFCSDNAAKHSSFAKLVELLKFGLIVLLTVMRLYEHAERIVF